MKKILIIGATSAMAEATARLWAAEGHSLMLLGRNLDRLASMTADLTIRGAASTQCLEWHADDISAHPTLMETAIERLGGLDIVLIAHGELGDQYACETHFSHALSLMRTNTLSVMSVLTPLANYFEARGQGVIAVISSVAGDRGRQSNYYYGAAKGAVTIFLQGLRQRLSKSGVRVITIKPGFVDTPMTKAFSKGFLWVQPEVIAKIIVKACRRANGELYAPAFWAMIMLMIRHIPTALFNRLAL